MNWQRLRRWLFGNEPEEMDLTPPKHCDHQWLDLSTYGGKYQVELCTNCMYRRYWAEGHLVAVLPPPQ